MAILTNEVVQFANGNTDFYEAAVKNYHSPTDEQNHLVNKAFFAELERKSGVPRDGLATEAWVSHPSVRWASFAVIDATIQAILPSVLTSAFGLFMDMKFVGVGDILKVRVMPNSLYTVSKGGKGERTTFRQKKFAADVVIAPEEHLITVYTDMYRVLAGKENVSDFIALVVMSIQQDMYAEALAALTTGLTSITTGTSLNKSGAFDMKTLVKMAEEIQVRNAGVRPVIAGSAVALMNVLPDSTSGYRMYVDGNGGAINLIRGILGFDVLKLDQALAKNGGLVLPDDTLYIVSPNQDKLVKGAVSSALTNSNQFYDNADITSNYTHRMNYAFEYVSAAKAGIYKITE